jgi:hypothetical protein
MLEKAKKDLDKISPTDINEMKQYKIPPPLVMMTMEAVVYVLDPNSKEKKNWDNSKKKMSESTFLSSIKNFD